jgi:hypothetical protein
MICQCELWARAAGTGTISRNANRKVCGQTITFVGVLNACLNIVVLEDSTCAHEQIIESRWDSKQFVGSSLVDMYTE